MSRLFKYIGASNDQVEYRGHDDPRGLLTEGALYTAAKVDVFSWHTDIYLDGFGDRRFNSVCFEEIGESCPSCASLRARIADLEEDKGEAIKIIMAVVGNGLLKGPEFSALDKRAREFYEGRRAAIAAAEPNP